MTAKYTPERLLTHLACVQSAVSTTLLFIALIFLTGSFTGKALISRSDSPTISWKTTLNTQYRLPYVLQDAGLTILVLGFIIWLRVRNHSQRSERGMMPIMNGAAIVFLYFGQKDCVSRLAFTTRRDSAGNTTLPSATYPPFVRDTHRRQHRTSTIDCQMNSIASHRQVAARAWS